MLNADRSPNMQSAFLPELHRWISKLIARHLHACPPGDRLITKVKETVILYKKEFRKMKKSRISPWSERDESAKWLRDCLWLCQACKRGFTCRPMWRNLRQAAHSYPQADICSAPPPPIVTSITHTHTHTHIHTHTYTYYSPVEPLGLRPRGQ